MMFLESVTAAIGFLKHLFTVFSAGFGGRLSSADAEQLCSIFQQGLHYVFQAAVESSRKLFLTVNGPSGMGLNQKGAHYARHEQKGGCLGGESFRGS